MYDRVNDAINNAMYDFICWWQRILRISNDSG